MTLNSLIRTMAAASRKAQRESIKRQREYNKQLVLYAKQRAIQNAADEVDEYINRILVIKSMHHDCGDEWNWNNIKTTAPPLKPEYKNLNEVSASSDYANYKPGIFDKLFGRVEKIKSSLNDKVVLAKQKDEADYQNNVKKYEIAFREWQELNNLASRILDGDINAYKLAIEQTDPFSEIMEIGSSISFNIADSKQIEILLHVNSAQVIPSEEKTQLKSGKLSTKPMNKTKFNELYQDYVCSCVLRVAREVFALLPVEKAIITAVGELLDTKTGYLEKQPILSVLIPRATLDKLNLQFIDPSDSMKNFIHRMKFKKTSGFEPVEKIMV